MLLWGGFFRTHLNLWDTLLHYHVLTSNVYSSLMMIKMAVAACFWTFGICVNTMLKNSLAKIHCIVAMDIEEQPNVIFIVMTEWPHATVSRSFQKYKGLWETVTTTELCMDTML